MGRKLALLPVLLCATAFHLAFSFKDGFVANGNFELAPKASDMKGTVVVGGAHALPGWEISGFVEYIKSARTCAQEQRLNVSVAPDSGVVPMQTLYSSNGWDAYAWAFQAEYPQVEIVIHNPGVEADPACGPLIDSVALRALYPPRPTNKNILKNGGFEEGPYMLPNTSWGVLIPPNIEDDHSPLPGWMVESLKAVKYIDSDHFSVPKGKRAMELVAGKESAIAQVARTIPGKTYVLSFAVGDASNSCVGSMSVEAFAGKDTIKVPYESKGKGGFKSAVLKFVAVSTRTRIMFFSTFYTMRSDDHSSLCGPVIDDVKLFGLRKP
ncbi:hypothetical protein L6164_024289 [Bauhinia variegata]|uniref:Uncharacterized protein n=1 Tax=Bauhinia variegata TaxID=167791 RepID=A0ACB9LZE2_BAUVA|nr:hypothetical protein L6164_024289 [Bauhinia variegata]